MVLWGECKLTRKSKAGCRNREKSLEHFCVQCNKIKRHMGLREDLHIIYMLYKYVNHQKMIAKNEPRISSDRSLPRGRIKMIKKR